jgi:hypothetical protein
MSDYTEPVADIAAYPWALRVRRFDDEGLTPDQRQHWEAKAGRPLDRETDWGLWNPPRSQWGDGPWQTEPDLVEWREDGVPYPLMMIRGMQGAWCGYAGLPPGHPLFGAGTRGGASLTQEITWASPCGDDDGPLRPTGEPPNCWWLGFDCAHVMQYAPRIDCLIRRERSDAHSFAMFNPDRYVTLDECRHMTIAFARELLALARPEGAP